MENIFKDNLFKSRNRKNLSQRTFIIEFNKFSSISISKSALASWERGEFYPTVVVYKNICDFFGYDMDTFFTKKV